MSFFIQNQRLGDSEKPWGSGRSLPGSEGGTGAHRSDQVCPPCRRQFPGTEPSASPREAGNSVCLCLNRDSGAGEARQCEEGFLVCFIRRKNQHG